MNALLTRRPGVGSGAVRLALAAVLLAGCFRYPLLDAAPDRPALLVPGGRAGVVDGRARFREIWCAVREDHGRALPEDRPCDEALVRLDGEGPPPGRPVALGAASGALRVVVVPGFLGECFKDLALPFADGMAHLATHGYRTGTIMVSGRSSSRHNAAQLREAILATALAPGERLLLVGHSKGSVDVLEALVAHPEIVPRVAAVVSVAGAINGSPLADGLRGFYATLLRKLPVGGCDAGDGGGLDSLRRGERLGFLATAALPASVAYFSVGGIVDPARTSRLLRPAHRHLAALDPRNDGQVLWTDAVIPGATLLGYVRADHWAIALPLSRVAPALSAALIEHNAFPREVLLESIVRMVEDWLPSLGRRPPQAPAPGLPGAEGTAPPASRQELQRPRVPWTDTAGAEIVTIRRQHPVDVPTLGHRGDRSIDEPQVECREPRAELAVRRFEQAGGRRATPRVIAGRHHPQPLANEGRGGVARSPAFRAGPAARVP